MAESILLFKPNSENFMVIRLGKAACIERGREATAIASKVQSGIMRELVCLHLKMRR